MLILNRRSWILRLFILTFQKFNEIIDSSRAEADLAEANITEIERLISSANNKSDEATANLGDSQELVEEAASIAEGARDIANQTQQVRRSGLSVIWLWDMFRHVPSASMYEVPLLQGLYSIDLEIFLFSETW